MRFLKRFFAATFALALCPAAAKELGYVDTTFNPLSPNDKIVIDAFPDPKVSGVTCHLSHARKGGVKSMFGLAEDSSDASVACRQTGKITVNLKDLPQKEQVFKISTSALFKTMQIVRFVDIENNTLVYLVYSDHLIDGSPKNAISSVPVMPWGN